MPSPPLPDEEVALRRKTFASSSEIAEQVRTFINDVCCDDRVWQTSKIGRHTSKTSGRSSTSRRSLLKKLKMVSSHDLEAFIDCLTAILKAAYAIVVRSSEYDLSPDMLDDIVARTVAFERGNGSGRKRDRDEEDEYGPDD